MFEVDWRALFVPSGSLVEIALRGTAVYLALFLILRFLPRRTLSQASTSDILIIVLIADAVQNGMAGEYRSITEALVLAVVIIGWAVVIDWLDHRFPDWQLSGGKPLVLIEDGKFVRENLRRQLITEDEVLAQLRQHGLESPERVRRGYIESDGNFTLVLRGGVPVQKPPHKRST